MHSRCRDKGNTSWQWYGGKGISVCDEWGEFTGFKDWSLANGYSEGLSIDRIDPSAGYSPCNCEFVTRSENTRRMLAMRGAEVRA